LEDSIQPEVFDPAQAKIALSPLFRWLCSVETWEHFIAGASIWLLILLAVLVSAYNGNLELDAKSIFEVLGLIGVVGIVGSLLPDNFWINYVFYPVGNFVLLIGGAILHDRYKANIAKKKLAKSTAAVPATTATPTNL